MATITVDQNGNDGTASFRPSALAVQRFFRNDSITSGEKDLACQNMVAAGVKTLVYHYSGGVGAFNFSTRDTFPGPLSSSRDWSALTGARSMDVMFSDLDRLRSFGAGDEKIVLILFDHSTAVVNGDTTRDEAQSNITILPAAQYGASPAGIMGYRAVCDAIIARYDPSGPDRIRGFSIGQEKKGWPDITNTTLDKLSGAANNLFSYLKANYPGYERWFPHFNLWSSHSNIANRHSAIDALIAGGSTLGENDDTIIDRLMSQITPANITHWSMDNSITNSSGDSWSGDYTTVRAKIALEYHVARVLRAKMDSVFGAGHGIKIAAVESYFSVSQTTQDWANILVSGSAPVANAANRRDPTWSSALSTAIVINAMKASKYGMTYHCRWEPQEGTQSGGEAVDGNVASWFDKDGNAYTALTQIRDLLAALPEGSTLYPVTVDDADIVAVAGRQPGGGAETCYALNMHPTSAKSTGITATGGTVSPFSIPPLEVHTFDLPALTGEPAMSLYQTMQGTVVAPTSDAGTNVVTLLDSTTGDSFDGVVAFFWTSGQTATGTAAGASMSFGASDGTNHGWCGYASDDNVATKNVGKYQRNDSCIGVISDGTPTVSSRATCAFTTGTMTLTWPDAPPTGSVIHYLVLGGTDIAARVGSMSIPFGTVTNQTVSSLPFDPDHLMCFGCRQIASTPTGGTVHGQFHLGMSDGSTQWCTMAGEPDGVGTSTGVRDFRTDRLISAINDTTTIGFDMEASGATFASGAFTIVMTNMPDTANALEFYVAMRAPSLQIGTETKPVTNITEATTTTTEPGAVFFASSGDFGIQSTTSGEGCESFAIGAMTANAQGSIWAGSDDGQATSATDKRHSTTTALEVYDPGTPTNVGTATFSAFGATSFTLSWAGTSANPTDFGWFAVPKATANLASGPPSALLLLGVG